MLRRSPLKRTPFKTRRPVHEPAVEREPRPMARLERVASFSGGTTGPAPKTEPMQHQGYMRLVRTFHCERCGRAGPSEFAHADEGKGQSIKSDCRAGTSLCGYRSPEDPGCHWLVGTARIYQKDERRALEKKWAASTRAKVRALGLWPKRLPPWSEA